jgi:hypothetical protein
VLQRFSAAAAHVNGERVLATLDDVDLVATRGGGGLVVDLAPGEQLALRKRLRA